MKSKNSDLGMQESGKYDAKAIQSLKGRAVMAIKGNSPVNFSADNTIVAYRLEKAVADMLQSISGKLKFNICWADCVTDLIAVPAFMNIVNPLKLKKKEMDEIGQWFSFLEEAGDPNALCILFTSKPTFKIPPKVKKFVLNSPVTIDADYLKLKILNKKASSTRHNNQHRSYDRKIFRLFKILKVLKTDEILYINDMCNEFNISAKTLKRDIELLNALGEIIEYDKSKKGYVFACPGGIMYED